MSSEHLGLSGGVAVEEVEAGFVNTTGPPSSQDIEDAKSLSKAGVPSHRGRNLENAYQSPFSEQRTGILRSGSENYIGDGDSTSFMASERLTHGSLSSTKSTRSMISRESEHQRQGQDNSGLPQPQEHLAAMTRNSTGTGTSIDSVDREIASKVERIKRKLRALPNAQEEQAGSIISATKEAFDAKASSEIADTSAIPHRRFKLRKNFDASRNHEGINWFSSSRDSKTFPRNFATPEGLQTLASSSNSDAESAEGRPSVSRSASLRIRNARLPPAYIQPANQDATVTGDRLQESKWLESYPTEDSQDPALPHVQRSSDTAVATTRISEQSSQRMMASEHSGRLGGSLNEVDSETQIDSSPVNLNRPSRRNSAMSASDENAARRSSSEQARPPSSENPAAAPAVVTVEETKTKRSWWSCCLVAAIWALTTALTLYSVWQASPDAKLTSCILEEMKVSESRLAGDLFLALWLACLLAIEMTLGIYFTVLQLLWIAMTRLSRYWSSKDGNQTRLVGEVGSGWKHEVSTAIKLASRPVLAGGIGSAIASGILIAFWA